MFIHGVSVTAGNVDRVLRHVHERLMKLEGVLAASFRSLDEELKARVSLCWTWSTAVCMFEAR